MIRLWIAKGAVQASRQSGKTGTLGALWLHVDEETEARLLVLANEARLRSDRRRKPRGNEPTASE